MRTGILASTPLNTVKAGERLHQGEGVLNVDDVIIPVMIAKNHPTLAMKPMIPSTRPTTASVPPPNAPPLVEIRWREMNPMMAAAGPSKMPKQMKLQATDTMPTISAAIASPSFRGAA
jgi:hypothetical protein